MNEHGKSDRLIVPGKSPNKAVCGKSARTDLCGGTEQSVFLPRHYTAGTEHRAFCRGLKEIVMR